MLVMLALLLIPVVTTMVGHTTNRTAHWKSRAVVGRGQDTLTQPTKPETAGPHAVDKALQWLEMATDPNYGVRQSNLGDTIKATEPLQPTYLEYSFMSR
jgi:hypothetical protein